MTKEAHPKPAEPDSAGTKSCPKCGSTIPQLAVVCPVCRSDIGEKTAGEIRRDRLLKVAAFLKDWISFPAAAFTAIAAFILAAETNVLQILRLDTASVTMQFLRQDLINVGADDTSASRQGDEIFVHVPFLRSVLVNEGASVATVRPEFMCSQMDSNSKTITGHFYFIDIQTQKKVLDDIEVDPKKPSFVNVALRDMGSKDDGYGATKEPNTCMLNYSDKYGAKIATIAYTAGDTSPMEIGGVDDTRVARRDMYCAGMAKGLSLGGEPIDCLSDRNLIAIEPVYLWEHALERALKQSGEFRQFTQGTATRIPGLILQDCAEGSCEQNVQEMTNALRHFTPNVTVWLCPPAKTELSKCTKTEFPVAAP
ncbi:hypothetical protein RFN25_30555 [Mesorhizobium abyssinicae]|uniref:Zinc ribbon domain-containing protein n=2 Tax=Mesorhizobium TaxID=68287 RepID=A0ABU4Z675_9HYPH|nr:MULTISPECIES: hypothetical protein [Mesorhizobium]MDX8437747.1 hypothetical protein [Mesorhizobium abyssinicae]MDX8456436.1 hypothetical protein [Mesorhizobium sp. VK9D]MDX8494700.1 hypothetical protein [Mesorhizobium sp. VK22B]